MVFLQASMRRVAMKITTLDMPPAMLNAEVEVGPEVGYDVADYQPCLLVMDTVAMVREVTWNEERSVDLEQNMTAALDITYT